MGMHTLDATLVLLVWSNLAKQISATASTLWTPEHESHITSPHQNQSLALPNPKHFSAFVGGDTFDGENSLELLNDSYSSDELVRSSSEFSDNLKDILKVEEEEEEGSTYSSEDNFYDDNYSEEEEEEEEYNTGEEQESDLNDEGQGQKSDFDMTSRSPALESGENVSMGEVDLLTRGGEPSETTTNRSLIIEQEESLVEGSMVEESMVEESMVKCFYVAPSSTFANLPDSISCSCAGAASTFKVFPHSDSPGQRLTSVSPPSLCDYHPKTLETP